MHARHKYLNIFFLCATIFERTAPNCRKYCQLSQLMTVKNARIIAVWRNGPYLCTRKTKDSMPVII